MTTNVFSCEFPTNDTTYGWDLVWRVDYEYSTPRPATHTDPPEGGLEIASDPELIEVMYIDSKSVAQTLDRNQFKAQWDHLATAKAPSHNEIWEAISADFESRS